MADSRIQKQQERVLKAQEQLGVTLVKERESRRKRRDGRLLKLGVLAEQMFKAGDLTLLGRFEQAALEQYKDRKVDRLDFELDEPLNWFDKTREESMLEAAQNGPAAKPVPAAPASSPTVSASAAKAATSAASRPTINGASGSNGASAPAAPSTTASA